ncbi:MULTISPECIES: hypothetical protein [Salinicoccus]|jgi:hypothetical protein|uniref:Lipoprotein n=1 Tax=Salinicoccus roseus TaxID=45670 RepID=A0ABT4YGB4_9STAP|nr:MULTISPECIES: hypothetical protein [Salinicoccus]MCC4722717.1 hypothetical protein [Salinicoccus sp. RF5]MDB0579859.1 hypothetical protein [Salinicoccus roseus]|tara:strand:- start:77 stop:238 length:162 start_codon:yes stop_codon:yes gene_type:complete
MKRFRLLITAAMLSTLMAACGMNNDSNEFDQQQTINDTMNQQSQDGSDGNSQE